MTIVMFLISDIIIPLGIIYGGVVVGLYMFTLLSLILTLIPGGWLLFESWLFYFILNEVVVPIFDTPIIPFVAAVGMVLVGRAIEAIIDYKPQPKDEDSFY